jgi:hypothetical protein
MGRPAVTIDPAELLALAETMSVHQLAAHYGCHYQTIHTRLHEARAAGNPIMAYQAPRGWKRGSCHPGLPCWENCLDRPLDRCIFAPGADPVTDVRNNHVGAGGPRPPSG